MPLGVAAACRVEPKSAIVPSIPGFWDTGSHDPLPVEPTWQEFVLVAGGEIVSNLLPEPRTLENADFFFENAGVLAELKEIETEFSQSGAFSKGFNDLMNRVLTEDPTWKPLLLGGSGKYPGWFHLELVRLFRPPLSRVLKKANRQLRETKKHFKIHSATGVLILANDGFTSIGPEFVHALAALLLIQSYSSIDCLVYITVNRYVAIQSSDVPRLVWAPTYSHRAPDSLVTFIDGLGRKWFNFLEGKVGPFTARDTEPADSRPLRGSKSIVLPAGAPASQIIPPAGAKRPHGAVNSNCKN